MPLEFNEETHTYTLDGKVIPSVTEICGIINNGIDRLNPSVLAQAAARGTAVHEITQLIDYGIPPNEIDEITPDLAPYINAYLAFKRDYQPEWEQIEKIVCDPELEYAGTLDRFGRIDGRCVLADIKTTASAPNASRLLWSAQTFAYARLIDTDEYIQRIIIHLKSDGKYSLIDLDETDRKNNIRGSQLFTQLLKLHKLFKGGNTK